MDRQAYKDEIRFQLTGGVLDLELDDKALDMVLDSAMREIQRYISTTKLITVPFSQCIDFTDCGVNAVTKVYRATGFAGTDTLYSVGNGLVDPMYATQWQLLSGSGNLFNFSDYVYNYASWNTLLQIRNTTSTDLAFRWDGSTSKLYINVSSNVPDSVTVEFVPKYKDVSEVVSDYWIDMIVRLSVALTKVAVGRIRSRFTLNNALWGQDGASLLAEGTEELKDIREKLNASTQLCYPID